MTFRLLLGDKMAAKFDDKELEVLYAALNSDFGVEVKFSGPFGIVMSRLYSARRSDPELECIQIHRPLDRDNTIWLVKNPERIAMRAETLKENRKAADATRTLDDILGDL